MYTMSTDETALRLLADIAVNLDLVSYGELADLGAKMFGENNLFVRRLRAEEELKPAKVPEQMELPGLGKGDV